MKTIDTLFCRIFNTKGGFYFNYVKVGCLKPYGGYKWYPIIHLYDNTWFKFFEIEYKSKGCQITFWNHYKYNEYTDTENTEPVDDYNETVAL